MKTTVKLLSIPPSSATRNKLSNNNQRTVTERDGTQTTETTVEEETVVFRSSTATTDTPVAGTIYEDQEAGTVFCNYCLGYTLPEADGVTCSVCHGKYARYGLGQLNTTPLGDGIAIVVALLLSYLIYKKKKSAYTDAD